MSKAIKTPIYGVGVSWDGIRNNWNNPDWYLWPYVKDIMGRIGHCKGYEEDSWHEHLATMLNGHIAEKAILDNWWPNFKWYGEGHDALLPHRCPDNPDFISSKGNLIEVKSGDGKKERYNFHGAQYAIFYRIDKDEYMSNGFSFSFSKPNKVKVYSAKIENGEVGNQTFMGEIVLPMFVDPKHDPMKH